jgi:riboflavin kinase/FMN adenylyltransferase
VEASLSDQHVVRVSSTMVRWLVQRGRMFDAATLLGRPYELIGPVVRGDRRGRTFDVPTANLDHGECLLPADGIYAGTARHENGAAYPAAISVGTKPTFGDRPRSCEAHLIGYDGALDDYGWTLHLEIRSWLRDQIRYDDAGALVRQLKRDISRAAELCDTSIRS